MDAEADAEADADADGDGDGDGDVDVDVDVDGDGDGDVDLDVDPDNSQEHPSSPSAQTRKRKRREWIKSEHAALRGQMMRFGYGRWDSIISNAPGRLSERHPQELIPVARRFIARCYVHARPGVERKSLMDILGHHPKDSLQLGDDAATEEINQLINVAEEEVEPGEQRKYVRWARKLRLLSRLNDVHDHPSMDRLRVGELKVYTPPPTLYWTSEDDADLIIGSYKHGYGQCEAMRNDPELVFLGRYSPAAPARKPSTPSKPDAQPARAGANAASDDDEDDDEDADEDEDDRQVLTPPDDDDDNSPEGALPNPKKRLKLGDGSSKKEEPKLEPTLASRPEDFDMSPGQDRSSDVKMAEKSEPKPADAMKDEPTSDVEKTKKKFRIIPRRGPRIGNEDGFNNPEDAKAAHARMADENGLVPFPNSEALMRRLKSIINSCAKEYDRDQREMKKKELAASRAKRRKDDLAQRKAIKEAEKTRQRAARRIAKSQPFSKKEAVEFEKALANFGVAFLDDGKTVNWTWFHRKVEGFEPKYDETMWCAYLELLAEAHRIRDLSAAKEEEDYETVDNINASRKTSAVFSTLTVDRAERLIERLQFFRILRGEVLPHPKLNSILRGFKKSRDMPMWWKSSDDESLLIGVDRYGVNAWEEMGNDSELSFQNSMKAWYRKNSSDSKTLKRPSMPKASAGIKRAFALVRYFASRANDPHFEMYTQGEAQSAAVSGESDKAGHSRAVKAEEVEDTVRGDTMQVGKMEATVDEDVRDRRSGGGREESGRGGRRKAETGTMMAVASGGSVAVGANGSCLGRGRSLRPSLMKIRRDENGVLILPCYLGDGLYLLSVGKIDGREGFCENGVILPVGYRVIRQMGGHSFLCEIGVSGNRACASPEFSVSELHGFDEKATAEDYMWEGQRAIATGRNLMNVWMKVVNEFICEDRRSGKNKTMNKISVGSGVERFGLHEPTIVYHVQKLPGAQSVEGFEMLDFTAKGGGGKIEASVGVFDAMMKGLDALLEERDDGQAYDAVMTDEEENARYGATVEEECEMSIPEEWIKTYATSWARKKHRRRSSAYWE